MSEIIDALASGGVTATALTQGYLARIEAYDRAGPYSIPCARSIPTRWRSRPSSTAPNPRPKQPLAGMPILVKDNIATGDKQPTTAGSLALDGARAKGDATVVKLLRDAGAVILGKANLTEFANILAIGMPSGYSSLGGQVKNPSAALSTTRHPGRAARRLEFGFRGRRGRRAVRGRDRHRDLGLAAVPPARMASSR